MSIITYDKLDPAFKAKWVAALRSGDYKQTRGILYSPVDHAFCCLGVNLKLRGYTTNSGSKKAARFIDIPLGPKGGWNAATKVDKAAINRLVDMNDNGKTFAEIADWIEENL